MEEMKVRIKKDFLPCFFPVIAVLLFVFISPAFAEFKKVNECELARANASLTGQPATPADEAECAAADAAADIFAAIPVEGEPSANGGGFFSIHDEYGYDWLHLQNLKVVGDPYYEAPPPSSPLTAEAGRYGDTTYVTIGLGSQEVELDSWDTNVTIGCCSEGASSACCHDQILGSIHLDGLDVKTDGTSHVTMYKSDGQMGIGVNVDATIDRISLATLSWGDHDGYPGARKAGYVGLKDTNITVVTVSGLMAISVGTVANGVKSVHMQLGNGVDNLDVGMASLDTTVVLGDKKDFSGTKYVLGTLYMATLKMNVGGYLDIYNPANNGKATTLGFGLNIPSLTLNTLSWGDPDGYPGARKAGYVGLMNLVIHNLAIAGQATLGEVCVKAGDTGIYHLPVGKPLFFIEFSKLNVRMAYLSADLALGNRKDNLNQVLGTLSLSGLNMDITGSVRISAH
jgi:hypothetical protein